MDEVIECRQDKRAKSSEPKSPPQRQPKSKRRTEEFQPTSESSLTMEQAQAAHPIAFSICPASARPQLLQSILPDSTQDQVLATVARLIAQETTSAANE